jgi:hypothetical protein
MADFIDDIAAYEAGERSGAVGYWATIDDALPDNIDSSDPYAVAAYITALRAVLDALNEADLRMAATMSEFFGDSERWRQRAGRYRAAADALHALEAEQ